jgi:hypothetical protein
MASRCWCLKATKAKRRQVLHGVIEQALSGEPVAAYTRTQPTARPRSLLSECVAIIFVMIGVLLGALVMAST